MRTDSRDGGIVRPGTVAIGLLGGALLLSGCIFQTVREQQAALDVHCRISGTVKATGAGNRPLVVTAFRHVGGDKARVENWELANHFVLESAGRWMMPVGPGTYGLGAFEDRNADLVYQPGEPFLRVDLNRLVTCGQGEEHASIALVVPKDGKARIAGDIDITALQARSVQEQLATSLGAVTAVGKLTTLDDPRFSEENAKSGLWKPFDFLFDAGPGVYFLEPYRADRIPVLFVHGINGTPTNFRYLIEHLDRNKFQPWVYFYPSGAHLANIADHLNQTMRKLQRQHGFTRFHVVAHSMGGLVSRGFILRYYDTPRAAEIPLYLTIATPWGGHKSAESGVKHAPAVVRVWYDMVPGSDYNRSLFYKDADARQRRLLPSTMPHHLLFTFNRNSTSFGESDDRTVTVASQMYAPAQEEARRLYGFDLTHTGVLEDDKVSALVNRLLASGGR